MSDNYEVFVDWFLILEMKVKIHYERESLEQFFFVSPAASRSSRISVGILSSF